MGFILNAPMAVEAGEGRPVSRAIERLDVNLKVALLAALLVTTDAIFGTIGREGVDGRTTDKQRASDEGDNHLAKVVRQRPKYKKRRRH
jgi:hypothetical protein